jgi:hypothetical protein
MTQDRRPLTTKAYCVCSGMVTLRGYSSRETGTVNVCQRVGRLGKAVASDLQ